jgi:O-antigen ligase
MWKAALNIAADHPVVGVGPATFNLHYPIYHEPIDMGTYGYFVHNDYLQLLAEGGPLLLLFLLTFTGMLIVALFRSGWQVLHGDPRQV